MNVFKSLLLDWMGKRSKNWQDNFIRQREVWGGGKEGGRSREEPKKRRNYPVLNEILLKGKTRYI